MIPQSQRLLSQRSVRVATRYLPGAVLMGCPVVIRIPRTQTSISTHKPYLAMGCRPALARYQHLVPLLAGLSACSFSSYCDDNLHATVSLTWRTTRARAWFSCGERGRSVRMDWHLRTWNMEDSAQVVIRNSLLSVSATKIIRCLLGTMYAGSPKQTEVAISCRVAASDKQRNGRI